MPRLAPCWSRFRNNVPNDGPLDYFKKAIAIPVIDDLRNHLFEQMKDRNLVELFAILPSIIVNDDIDTKSLAKELFDQFADDLGDSDIAFQHEIKRWQQYCADKFECKGPTNAPTAIARPISKDKRRRNQQQEHERVDGKAAFSLTEPPDGFIDSLSLADADFFPNVRKLILGATSPVGSTEAERAASGIRRLKTPYRSTMSDLREGNLNLIQLQRIVPEIDVDEVIAIFARMKPRRLFEYSVLHTISGGHISN